MSSMEYRQQVRQEVLSIVPCDTREASDIEDTLEWIESAEELCRIAKPDTPPKHLISYFVLVDGDYLLLVDHINAELWLPTGGHVDPGEHPRKTVEREALEELNLSQCPEVDAPLFLTITQTVGKTRGHTDVSLWYVLNVNRQTPLRYDHSEFSSIKWFHRDSIPFDRSDPEIGRFVRKRGQSTFFG